jgi:hypothetical protein
VASSRRGARAHQNEVRGPLNVASNDCKARKTACIFVLRGQARAYKPRSELIPPHRLTFLMGNDKSKLSSHLMTSRGKLVRVDMFRSL